MTGADELRRRREEEALRIRASLNRQRGEQRANTKGGEGTVAFVCLLYTSPSPRDS